MIILSEYIDFLVHHNLTQRQFLLLLCIKNADQITLNKYAKLYGINDGVTPIIGEIELDELIDRKYLVQMNDNGFLQDYVVGSAFVSAFANEEIANEFLDEYPLYVVINKRRTSLSLWDLNEFRKVYLERIKYSRKEHNKIMLDLQYAKAHNLINCKLEKFVCSEQWRVIRKERLNEDAITTITPSNEATFEL